MLSVLTVVYLHYVLLMHIISGHILSLEKLFLDMERRGWSIWRAPVIPYEGWQPSDPGWGSV